MSAHSAALGIHVTAGTIGLVLGPVLMVIPKRPGPHTRLGAVYHWTFLVLFVSALWLSILNPDVWWLALVGGFSYAFALLGYASARRRRPGWLIPHVAGQGGSYIAMVSALLTVNWETLTGSTGTSSVLPFVLPSLVGTPLIIWVNAQVAAGRRPKAWIRSARPAPRESRAGA